MLGKGVHTLQSHIYVLGEALVSVIGSVSGFAGFKTNEAVAIHWGGEVLVASHKLP